MVFIILFALWILIINSGYILAALILVWLFYHIFINKNNVTINRFQYLALFLLLFFLIFGNSLYYASRRQHIKDIQITSKEAVKKVTFKTYSTKEVSKYETISNKYFVDGNKVLLTITLFNKDQSHEIKINEYEKPGPYVDMGSDLSKFKGLCPGEPIICKEYFQSKYGSVYKLDISSYANSNYYYFEIGNTKIIVSSNNEDLNMLKTILNELIEYAPDSLPMTDYLKAPKFVR